MVPDIDDIVHKYLVLGSRLLAKNISLFCEVDGVV